MRRKVRRHRGKITHLSENLTSVLRADSRRKDGMHPEIWARWGELVGKRLAAKAVPHALRGRILYIAVVNSTWMQELSFMQSRLLERLAEQVGPYVVQEIRMNVAPKLSKMPNPGAPQEKRPAAPKLPYDPHLLKAIEHIESEEVKEAVRRAVRKHMQI